MSWRTVVITRKSKLELSNNYLVVNSEDTEQKIHLSEIGTVILESMQLSITAALMITLVKNNIKLIFCDAKIAPTAELVGYYGTSDTSGKLRQQIKWDDNLKNQLWQQIVHAKISNQKECLKIWGKEGQELLESYLHEIQLGDKTNREALAAKDYFNSLFGIGFTRSAEDPINAALNYGYSIILSSCNREIVANGYATQLGVFHNNIYNRFNLGCDIMEPLRPFIDNLVYGMWVSESLECFERAERYMILDVLNTDVVFDGKKQVLNYAIKLYCRSFFEAINKGDFGHLKFPRFKQ